MRAVLIRRPIVGATQEDVLNNSPEYTEPVAIVIVGYDISAEELQRVSETVLSVVGNKIIDTEALERVFNSFLK